MACGMAYFLVVEVPDADSPMSHLSRSLPDVVMEAVVQAPMAEAASFPGVCEIRGGTAAQRDIMAAGLRGADPDARRIPAAGGCIRLAVRFPVAAIAPVWKALARFGTGNGLHNVWATLEEGVTYVRILAPSDRLEALESGLRAALKRDGFDADVGTEAVRGSDVVDRMTSMSDALGRFSRGAPEGF